MKAKTTLAIFSKKDFAISFIKTAFSNYYLLAIVFAMFSFNVFAQPDNLYNGRNIIKIHNGQNNPGEYNDSGLAPFTNGARNARIQFLYTRQELIQNGVDIVAGQNDKISQVAFHVSQYLFALPKIIPNVTIRVGYTVLKDFKKSPKYDIAQFGSEGSPLLTEVFSGPATIPALDGVAADSDLRWIEFPFNTSISIPPLGQNLIVEVSYSYNSDYQDGEDIIMSCSQATGFAGVLTRGCYDNTNILGKDLFTIGDGYNTTAIMGSRDRRPWTKFTYEASAANTLAAYYEVINSQCIGDEAQIITKNIYGTGITGFDWDYSNAPNSGYVSYVVGQPTSNLVLPQSAENTYFKIRAYGPSLLGGNGLESAELKAVNTYDLVAGVKKWVSGTAPLPGESAYIKVTPDSPAAIWPGSDVAEFCSVKVAAGAILTVPAGKTLKLAKIISTNDIDGKIIFENGSSLIQTTEDSNEVVGANKIIYQRNSAPILRFDYTYYSSPVQSQNLFAVSPETLTDKFWSFANNGWVMEGPSRVMKPGKGYIIRGAQNIPISGTASPFLAEFKGALNNGNITLAADTVVGNYNLIGNPYPSAIDASKFIYTNNFLEGSIYFWNHADQPSANYPGTATYNYNNTNYTPMNGLGTTNGPTSFRVGAGQSFMVKTIIAGTNTVIWNNDMRVGGDNLNFYKVQNQNLATHNTPLSQSSTTNVNAEPAGRFWLDLQANNGAVQKMLIGYIQGATEGFDRMYDAEPMEVGTTALYAIGNDEQRLSIMAKGLPFDNEQIIPLGFVTNVPGNHTISKFLEDGFMGEYAVYINDKLTNTSHNLSESAYEFTTVAGTFNNRFIIAYKPKISVVVDTTVNPNKVVVFDKYDNVQLHSGRDIMSSIVVYDLSGRVLANVQNCNSAEVALSKLTRKNQLLIVEIRLANGDVETQKFRF